MVSERQRELRPAQRLGWNHQSKKARLLHALEFSQLVVSFFNLSSVRAAGFARFRFASLVSIMFLGIDLDRRRCSSDAEIDGAHAVPIPRGFI